NSLFYSYLLALFFLLFFFCCSRPPRHLHSFPTRRSSDLRPPGPGEEPAPHTEVGPVSLAQLQRHIAALGSPPVSTLVGLPLRREDRKSTRLNSSHVAISYAVFCLKKKKQKQCRPATERTW